MTEVVDPAELLPLGSDRTVTPEGFGFSSPMHRVLKKANREGGYYRAVSQETVIDVMNAIAVGATDVALVYDESSNKLLGLFTETDYIKVW
jgi:hypothetical protein